eukprot:gene1463-1699_t
MHSIDPAITHRDLKVENVLLDEETGLYKLCDFGSATQEVMHLKNKQDIQRAEEDIAKYTTPQYRSPEQVDLYRSNVVNEKVDIWALGCLLYKLLYYTTPFEEAGSLGILNGNYVIPPSSYSNEIICLIRFMLHPDATQRPDIFCVTNEVCRMRGMSPLFPNKGGNYHNPYTAFSPAKEESPVNQRQQSQPSRDAKPLPAVPKPLPQVPLGASGAGIPIHQQQDTYENEPDISPHLKRRSPINPQQPIIPPSSNIPPKRRPIVTSKGTPSTTPLMAPIPLPNNNKMDSPPVSFNLEHNETADGLEEIPALIGIITSSGEVTFDAECYTKLKSFTPFIQGKGIMCEIVKRPLREPVVCLKSLLVVHKLLMEGHQPFKTDAYESRDLFHNLHLGWLKQKEKFSEFLSQYSLLLHKLVLFHQKYYLIDGVFSFDESKWGLPDSPDSSHPISLSVLSGLLVILEQIFNTQNSITDISLSNQALSIVPLSLIISCVNILNSTSFAMYCFISGSIDSLAKISDQETLLSTISRFQSIYQTLRDQYAKLHSLPPFSSDIFFPTLPKSPPTFVLFSNNQQQQQQQHNNTNLHHNANPFDNPSPNEPTFNPFSTSSDSFDRSPFGAGSPVTSPRISTSNLAPSSNANTPSVSLPQSPVMSRKPTQFLSRFPQSVSMEDARLYTLILTPSPSPPQSPSFGRLSHSNSNPMQKSTNSLMPPPKTAPNPRGHRRSQSSTTDDVRRRQLLQQQLEQNKEFVQNQRQQIKINSRADNLSQSLQDDDEEDDDENFPITHRRPFNEDKSLLK